MKKFSFIIIWLFILQLLSGQTPNLQWVKQFGGTSTFNEGLSIAIDQSGNVYTTGYFIGISDFDPGPGTYTLSSIGWKDAFISKLDASGNFIWAKQFGGTGADYGTSIFVDSSNNVFTTGNFSQTVDFDPGPGTYTLTSPVQDIFISKLDSAGNFIWAVHIGGVTWDAYSNAITVDASGNVLTTGKFYTTIDFDPGPGTYTMTVPPSWQADAFISKLDPSGNFVWAKQIDGPGDIGGHSIATDAAGNVYTTGLFQAIADFDPGPGTYTLDNPTGIKDIYISKLDAGGNFVWVKQMVGTGYDQGISIALDASGNIYSAGYFEGTDDFDPGIGTFTMSAIGEGDAYVSKLDASGNFLWAKQLGGVSGDGASSLSLDASGNVYTTGAFRDTADFDPGPGTFTLNSAGKSDIFISKLNSSGNFVWAIQFGDTAYDVANSIAVDASANVFTTGAYRYNPDFDPSPGVFNLTALGDMDAFVHKICQGCSVGIDENLYNNDLSLFPNPTNGTLNLFLSKNAGNIYCKLLNSTGQTIMEKANLTSNEVTLDISGLADGIYFLEITTKDGVTKSKVIKN